ncbi:MAG: Synechococcus virus Syn5 [Deinococcota bacterium]|jgi:hypothetical protein
MLDITFNGSGKLIVCGSSVNSLNALEIYSEWKRWALTNPQWLPAMSALGGDPLPGGLAVGTYVFLENGWKIRPREAHHTLTIVGNLFTRDGSSAFVPSLGAFTVTTQILASSLAQGISTGGSSGLTTPQAAMLEQILKLIRADDKYQDQVYQKLEEGTNVVLLEKVVMGGSLAQQISLVKP